MGENARYKTGDEHREAVTEGCEEKKGCRLRVRDSQVRFDTQKKG
jgi:hypothetical protein